MMMLAILTGVFGAVTVIFLVVLIVMICHKRRHQGEEIEASFTLSM